MTRAPKLDFPVQEPQDARGAASGPGVVRGPARLVYLLLAGVLFVLAVLGALLPLLPTTPFLLLTSYFLVRSSPSLNQRLLNSRTFGPLLRDWQRHRAVRPHVKRLTLVVMPSAVLISAYFGNLGPVGMAVLLSAGLVGFVVVARLRVISE
jgi:uncharacterized membrane protein YbaN (DUF454 family)